MRGEIIMSGNITLTRQQQICVDYPADKNLVVQGVAGSGKSLVLVNRAIVIADTMRKKGMKPSVAIITYANSLVDYTDEVINADNLTRGDIDVSTLDSILFNIYYAMNNRRIFKPQYDIDKEILDNILNGKARSSSRFLKPEYREFMGDEIKWIKERSIFLKSSSDYETCVRVGRGAVRPSASERKFIYSIYEAYYGKIAEKGINDVNCIYEELYRSKEDIPDNLKYDFIMIDETQDLSLNKLMLAIQLARKALTFSADKAQKIYKTGFTWKELNIDIRGQASKKLSGTHRNTYEILALAKSLAEKNPDKKSNPEDYTDAEMPSRHGEKPIKFEVSKLYDEGGKMLEIIQQIKRVNPDESIAIIGRSRKELELVKKILYVKKISYDEIKGSNKDKVKILTPGVKVVTYHSSKGLEFDNVILPYLDDGSFPFLPRGLSSEDIEDRYNEARNLLYVGMTRAKNRLFMISVAGKGSKLLLDLDKNLYDIM